MPIPPQYGVGAARRSCLCHPCGHDKCMLVPCFPVFHLICLVFFSPLPPDTCPPQSSHGKKSTVRKGGQLVYSCA
ncbi:hypothetical protein XENTR_v10013074 [Xenopus tropicalis]|nr:hypothetical protein XENTR_v10013074 [Xenopus tropicalis]